jgi:hypothetical protein
MIEQPHRLADILFQLVHAKPGPSAPKFPRNIEAILPGADADPLPAPNEIEVAVHIGQALGIEYRDSAEACSRRIVTVMRVKPGPESLLAVSWCYMRAAYRSFRTDRITALIDLETGIVESDGADIENAFSILMQSRIGDGYETTRRAIEKAGPGMNILRYLSRCDGRVHPAETQAILSYLDSIAVDLNLVINEQIARRLVSRMHVTTDMFHRSVDRLSRLEPIAAQRLALAVRRLVDADDWLSPEETACLIEVAQLEPTA